MRSGNAIRTLTNRSRFTADWNFATALVQSTSTLELARGIAGNVVAVHANLAYVYTLAKLLGIILIVSLGDALALLIRILSLLRTRRKADGQCRQNNEASHWPFSVRTLGQCGCWAKVEVFR